MSLPWITEWDVMVGRDQHNELCIPPWPPAASPMHQHFVAASMRWQWNDDAFTGRNVFIQGQKPCRHFHDISLFIPHVPLPLPGWGLLPAIIPLSGSKIALGSFRVYANGDPAGVWGPMLNCWSNFPRLSGTILPARLPTVFVGVSYTDILISLGHVMFDMLVSWALNKIFDKVSKFLGDLRGGPSFKLSESAGSVAKNVAKEEIRSAVNQAVSKLGTDLAKKLFGKFVKPLVMKTKDFIVETVQGWHARTNPGMEEKYIKVFEAEAPGMFAAHVYRIWLTQIRDAAFEECSKEYPELDASVLQSSVPEPSLEEFEQAINETIGPMIKDAVRGLLSTNEWEKLLASAQDGIPLR